MEDALKDLLAARASLEQQLADNRAAGAKALADYVQKHRRFADGEAVWYRDRVVIVSSAWAFTCPGAENNAKIAYGLDWHGEGFDTAYGRNLLPVSAAPATV